MTIAVEFGCKATKQTNKQKHPMALIKTISYVGSLIAGGAFWDVKNQAKQNDCFGVFLILCPGHNSCTVWNKFMKLHRRSQLGEVMFCLQERSLWLSQF